MDAAQWNDRYATSGLVWSADPNQFLPPEVANLQPGRALDLACGEGRNAVWLASEGWQVTGVDFSDVGLGKAEELAVERGVGGSVRWVVADATAWEGGAAYDLVVVFYLQLPHVDRRAAMVAAARSVAPGGTLLVVAHDSDNLLRGVGGPPDPAVLYSASDVVADVDAAGVDGFTVDRATQVLRPVEVVGEAGTPTERMAVDCLVRMSRSLDVGDDRRSA